MTRGIKTTRDLWVTFMQSQMFPWTRKNLETGGTDNSLVQGALRPIELWEYVFPEEHLPDVLAMMNVQNYTPRPEIKNYTWLLRKALKLKEVPKFPDKVPTRFIPMQGFAVYPVGVKDDVKQDFPNFTDAKSSKGYHQEGL